jgi:hypothetical protein
MDTFRITVYLLVVPILLFCTTVHAKDAVTMECFITDSEVKCFQIKQVPGRKIEIDCPSQDAEQASCYIVHYDEKRTAEVSCQFLDLSSSSSRCIRTTNADIMEQEWMKAVYDSVADVRCSYTYPTKNEVEAKCSAVDDSNNQKWKDKYNELLFMLLGSVWTAGG